MTGPQKLFKAVRESTGMGAKRHIAHEIATTYAAIPALTSTLLTEALALSQSSVWEDRVCASRIVEKMVCTGAVPDAFSTEEFSLDIDAEQLLKQSKYLSSYYAKEKEPEKVDSSKEFIDLEDHNVVLSLSNIKIPGARKKESIKKKKEVRKDPSEEKEKEKEKEKKKEVETFSAFCAAVLENLASYVWEIRHGAAQMALGIFRGICQRGKDVCVQRKLDGQVFLRALLSTLVRDQFNDYEMDVALSPVRETISKALQEMYELLPQGARKEVLLFLVSLGRKSDWQVRYSGLIGIKGVLGAESVCLTVDTARSIADVCVELLEDIDEDVRGLSAQLLSKVLQKRDSMEETEKIADIPAIIELCWSALAEEEDISASKAKIIDLLECIHKLGYSLGEIDRDRYLSVLGLLRNSMDSVRYAVISLLETLPAVSAADALSATMYSILVETEAHIQQKSALFMQRIAPAVDREEAEHIVHAMLRIIMMPAYAGDKLKKLGYLIVIGETDICTTDDGCKAAGPEKVLSGRVALFEALLSTKDMLPYVYAFFLQDRPASLPFFHLFKAVMIVKTGRADIQLQIKDIEKQGMEMERAASALVSSFTDTCTDDHAKRIFYLFGQNTPSPILRFLSRTIAKHISKYEPVYSICTACIVQKEKEENTERLERMERIEKIEEKRSMPGKRAKMDELAEVEDTFSALILIEETGDAFLSTEIFEHMQKNPKECISFLRPTVQFFSCTEEILSLFDAAVDECSVEVVSHIIKHSATHNQEYIVRARNALLHMPQQRDIDHRQTLGFIEQVCPASVPELLVVLVFPLIAVMNTPFSFDQVRESACKTFSSLVPIMHLRGNIQCTDQNLLSLVQQERERIDEMHKKEDISDVEVKVPLRPYQKKGIEWLCFLKKSGLSGMLCDDMGLGKTAQVLAFLAHEKKKRLSLQPDLFKRALVLCPSALTGHWKIEISNMFPTLKGALIQEYKGEDICIASYDKFRMTPESFSHYNWEYLILDEGHVIKNASTLLHFRVKTLPATQKILLSGTPIQNSVKELWALFDALMPGYLGSEKEFNATYLRPILKGREGGTSAEMAAARTRLEELHSKVLPFMLRRMKESVLSDLPPKVISDVLVPMGDEQRKLYKEVSSQTQTTLSAAYGEVSAGSSTFAQLSRLVRICSHPALLSGGEDPTKMNKAKRGKDASGKMLALLDLLQSIIPQSKVLVFCQYKVTIDLLSVSVEDALPGTKWCRLDGSIKGDARAALAHKFNIDPDISIMYLTTHAGGLGLNLTGADAVIFYEHDWNPMMDLQAMDRAHRLGQKRSVNVFRLITEGTIEESIMSLQNFKKYVAKTLVNQQNVEIESMDTANALERFKKTSGPIKEIAKEEEYKDLM